MDLTRKIDLRAFTLADPYRVVVDIPQVTFKLPPKAGETGRGLVKAYRFGLVMQGGSRIVLDLSKPVRIDKAFVLDAAEGQPARLVLDLVAIDRDTFMRSLALDSRPLPAPQTPRKFAPDPSAKGDPRPIIVVDPGHGGIDHGTRAAGGDITEKALVLDFALLLRDQLEKTGKYRVVMTRTDDTLRGAQRAGATGAAASGGAVHLDPRRRAAAGGGRRPGRDDLHAVRQRLRCRGGAPGRGGKPRRRDRGHRSFARAGRRGRHPDRPGAARNQDVFHAFRKNAGRPS